MGSRLDFEARLRALRAPKGAELSASTLSTTSSTSTASSAAPASPQSLAWPSVPAAPIAALPASSHRRSSFAARTASSVARDEQGWPEAPNMTMRVSSDGWPEVPAPPPAIHVSSRRSFVVPQSSEPLASQVPAYSEAEVSMRRQVSAPASNGYGEPERPQQRKPTPSTVQMLGPDYAEAVSVAQRAIESEREGHVRTAVEDYIIAGQLLIALGRRQSTADLQEIVKKKALALLQRAEGLADWIHDVQAQDASEEALWAAVEASQQSQQQALTNKAALVDKMRSDNSQMKQRLNQLVLLTKMRTRLRKVVRERRARKAAERQASQESAGDPETASSLSFWGNGQLNDVDGSDESEEEEPLDEEGDEKSLPYGDSQSVVLDDYDDEWSRAPLPSSVASSLTSSGHNLAAPANSPDERKVMLVNELHAVIGLPEINHLRKFEPLSADPTGDAKHEKLQRDLEAAKNEADELRSAVQDMERCLRLAAQHSKQRSIKMEQEKEADVARVRHELELVREELENERRLSTASFGSHRSSIQSDVDMARDREEFENMDVMRNLRSSLFKVFSKKKSRESMSGEDERSERAKSVVQRVSETHDSPRHRTARQPGFGADSDEEDGGVWL